MALILSDRYPGQAEAPSAGYPQGSYKNKTAPNALDGTPFERDSLNDTLGFLQSLLAEIGVSANGTVDRVGASQYFDALMRLIKRRGQPGEIFFHSGTTPPEGSFVANGANVSRVAYPELYAAIGTTWGAGNGTTTFGLPLVRDFIRPWAPGSTEDPGRVFGSVQEGTGLAANPAQFGANLFMNTDGQYGSITTYNQPAGTTTGPDSYRRFRPRNVALLACVRY